MIVIKRGKEPNSLLKFRKENPDADYESDMPTDVLKDIREQMWEEQLSLIHILQDHYNSVRLL